MGKLKAKRFGQIYEYLDQGGAGDLDLITLVRNNSATVFVSIATSTQWYSNAGRQAGKARSLTDVQHPEVLQRR